jgi:4-amino-4-deoxy-L-arabinose transferase-like glycosyltransferase
LAFSSQKHTTQDLLYLVPLSLFFLLFRLGHGSLASWDEGIYAALAREMAERGDWLTLRMDGIPWFDKPPLAVWFTALFFRMFGIHEFSARLFSALCGTGCVITTYFLGRQLLNRWTGFLGALVLLSSAHFIRYSRFGMLEAPFTLFLSLSLLFFWMGHNRNRYLIFSGVAAGLALFTDGFSAFLIFPITWLYAWWANRLEILGRSSYWIGVMIAAAIALPWHLSQLLMHRELVTQPVAWSWIVDLVRAFDPPGAHWYYYLRVLVNKYHPWILVGIVSAPYFLFRAIKEREEEILFLTVWMFFFFGWVTMWHFKRVWLAFPVYIPLSLSVAYMLSRVFREHTLNFVRAAFLVILILHVPYSHIFEQDYSRQVKGIAGAVKAKVSEEEVLALYNFHEAPAVSFYARRASVMIDGPEALAQGLSAGAPYILMKQSELEALGGVGFLTKNRLMVQESFEDLRFLVKRS